MLKLTLLYMHIDLKVGMLLADLTSFVMCLYMKCTPHSYPRCVVSLVEYITPVT